MVEGVHAARLTHHDGARPTPPRLGTLIRPKEPVLNDFLSGSPAIRLVGCDSGHPWSECPAVDRCGTKATTQDAAALARPVCEHVTAIEN